MAELTPMKMQYMQIKARYPDCLLMYRLGDFYELFYEDAQKAASELDLVLTTRDRNAPPDKRTPMCGVPFHSAETYIVRLLARGYKVAICEQLEDPKSAKGLVRRDVVRVLSPGTVTSSIMLKPEQNNYVCAICSVGGSIGLCFCDLSTGEMFAGEYSGDDRFKRARDEMGRFWPSETVYSGREDQPLPQKPGMFETAAAQLTERAELFDAQECLARVLEHFAPETPQTLGIDCRPAAATAAGAMLGYIRENLFSEPTHIKTLRILGDERYMELDSATLNGLELLRGRSPDYKEQGSLMWALNYTKTSMGARLLASWIERPLLDTDAINRRLDAVEELASDIVSRREIMMLLREVGDVRRIASRASVRATSPRDVRQLASYLAPLPEISRRLISSSSKMLQEIAELDTLEDLAQEIDNCLATDDLPTHTRDGGFIRDGFSSLLDELRETAKNGDAKIEKIQERERRRTGIKRLTIAKHRLNGYYIEVPRAQSENLPEEYHRCQTLTKVERYTTYELQKLEARISAAAVQALNLENGIFEALCADVAKAAERIQNASDMVARLDCLCSFAEAASRNRYRRPTVNNGGVIDIKNGRHPVVEKTLADTPFVPNDVHLSCEDSRVLVITGPNMAGKSTYMRQTALITLMAQAGSFVPADSAEIGIVDRVFARIGAHDDLASGRSTFMVEMSELADILSYATGRSLLILDEIGRGTGTYDGMAIARAVLEHCANPDLLGARTMFSTHYHELGDTQKDIDGVKNCCFTAEREGSKLIFLRKVTDGIADESYGIEAAQLAGVPDGVILRAKSVMDGYASAPAPAPAPKPKAAKRPDEKALKAARLRDGICEDIMRIDFDNITPLQTLERLYKYRQTMESAL